METTLPYNFEPRTYQLPVWNYMLDEAEGKRAICVWHRRAGKDLLSLNICLIKMLQRVGTYWHVLPTYRQGRNIVWNGKDREGRGFLDYIPPELITSSHNNDMRLTLKNGSILQVVGTDDVDRLVGTNPVGVVFSEYSLHDPSAWEYIRPILAENGGWALFIYTPRGKNHGYTLLLRGKDAGWFIDQRVAGSAAHATKRADGSPVLSDEDIEEERKAGMPEEIIQQEFYVSFESAMHGAYYSLQMSAAYATGRIRNVPYDPQILVDTSWDLGMDDDTCIVFSQSTGMEERIIDCYTGSGEPFEHYVKVLREKKYDYGKHFMPHDIAARELSSGKTRLEKFRGLLGQLKVSGRCYVTPLHEIEDGIEHARSIFPYCYFDQEKLGGQYGLIEALKTYRKEYDEKHRTYKGHPLHDWSSHYADAWRIKCWNTRKKGRAGQTGGRQQDRAEDDYSYA